MKGHGLSQKHNRAQVEIHLSNILREMTVPVEQILGAPRIGPLKSTGPGKAPSPASSSSALSQWKRKNDCCLPPVPRLKIPPSVPHTSGWFNIPRSYPQGPTRRPHGSRNIDHNIAIHSFGFRARRGCISARKSIPMTSQSMGQRDHQKPPDQCRELPPFYPIPKVASTAPTTKATFNHDRSICAAISGRVAGKETDRHWNVSKHESKELLGHKLMKKPEVGTVNEHGSKAARTLQEKRGILETKFKVSNDKCISLYTAKHFDEYEEESKKALRLCFDWALAMESELRLSENILRRSSTEHCTLQKRDILRHYDFITHVFASRMINELQRIGRKQTASFYRQGVQKVFLRRLALQKLWDRDMKIRISEAQQTITDALERSSPNSRDTSRERKISIQISMEKLQFLKRIILEYKLLDGVVEGIVSDHGNGYVEAGNECRVQ